MAKKKIRNLGQLELYVNKRLEKAMDEVGDEVAKELGDYVFKNWYQARGNPKDYNRTFQFLESVTFQTMFARGKFFTEVFFDPDLIDAMYDEYSSWNQHMSVRKEDVTEDIVGWIEYGQNSPLYSYDGIHMVENVREWCKKRYREMLKEKMASQGINLR